MTENNYNKDNMNEVSCGNKSEPAKQNEPLSFLAMAKHTNSFINMCSTPSLSDRQSACAKCRCKAASKYKSTEEVTENDEVLFMTGIFDGLKLKNGVLFEDGKSTEDLRSTRHVSSSSENSLLSRRGSDMCEESQKILLASRRSSESSKGEHDTQDDEDNRSKVSLGRRDSLLDAVLAAKMCGWKGLTRTESLESNVSFLSASSTASDCACEDCFLGLSDRLQPKVKPLKKNSNWRKVRNVVQWTPFIQTYKRHKYLWVQLAGHAGNFKAGYRQGTILKKLCPAEENAFEALKKDELSPFVPECHGLVEVNDSEKFLQLQDLLSDFRNPCVMDIKMGVRTYLEEELAKARHKPKLRKDMFEKMIQIDENAPSEAENRAKAVTKPRYMVWRETISSTATLGFRIEGVRWSDGTSSKDFKTTKTREQVLRAIASFLQGYDDVLIKYVQRLKHIRETLEKSGFFKSHELIGSSLLFVHDNEKCGVWLIDFAKTVPLPESVKISHSIPWVEGTHEDGYLIGLDNLTELVEGLQDSIEPPNAESVHTTDSNEDSAPSTQLNVGLDESTEKSFTSNATVELKFTKTEPETPKVSETSKDQSQEEKRSESS